MNSNLLHINVANCANKLKRIFYRPFFYRTVVRVCQPKLAAAAVAAAAAAAAAVAATAAAASVAAAAAVEIRADGAIQIICSRKDG